MSVDAWTIVIGVVGLLMAGSVSCRGLRMQGEGADAKRVADGKRWVTVGLGAGSVTFGLILLRVCYVLLSGENRPMSPETYQIIRMVIGLGAGFVATGLAGPFEIEAAPVTRATVKAGGPMGVTVFFYLVNPLPFGA